MPPGQSEVPEQRRLRKDPAPGAKARTAAGARFRAGFRVQGLGLRV